MHTITRYSTQDSMPFVVNGGQTTSTSDESTRLISTQTKLLETSTSWELSRARPLSPSMPLLCLNRRSLCMAIPSGVGSGTSTMKSSVSTDHGDHRKAVPMRTEKRTTTPHMTSRYDNFHVSSRKLKVPSFVIPSTAAETKWPPPANSCGSASPLLNSCTTRHLTCTFVGINPGQAANGPYPSPVCACTTPSDPIAALNHSMLELFQLSSTDGGNWSLS
mmetsp:Transcript_104480/g.270864  ORF Transcript_104480/g.270864 Transcript_104480/m.270864 type:complete len:219 (-) Transcript_104480:316-972(-)